MIKREKALEVGLQTLRQAGVEGVMVDVWWGIVENAGPGKYDFSAYKRLFHKVCSASIRSHATGLHASCLTCLLSYPQCPDACHVTYHL